MLSELGIPWLGTDISSSMLSLLAEAAMVRALEHMMAPARRHALTACGHSSRHLVTDVKPRHAHAHYGMPVHCGICRPVQAARHAARCCPMLARGCPSGTAASRMSSASLPFSGSAIALRLWRLTDRHAVALGFIPPSLLWCPGRPATRRRCLCEVCAHVLMQALRVFFTDLSRVLMTQGHAVLQLYIEGAWHRLLASNRRL